MRLGLRYFGGLGLEIGTHHGLGDVVRDDVVSGAMRADKLSPSGTSAWNVRRDVIGVAALGEASIVAAGRDGGGESLSRGDSRVVGGVGGVRGAAADGPREVHHLGVGGGERHEGDEERQELRGCGGREGRTWKVSDDAPRYRQSPKSRNVVAEAQSPGDRRRARRWRGTRGRRGHR